MIWKKRIGLVLVLAALVLSGRLQDLLPTSLALMNSGKLAEATVRSIDITAARATIGFAPAWQPASANDHILPMPREAVVAIPSAVAAVTAPGDKLLITYLPAHPAIVTYGAAHQTWFDPANVRMIIVAIVALACLDWLTRLSDRMTADAARTHRGRFVRLATVGATLAFGSFVVMFHYARWEIGMALDKRLVATEIAETRIADGALHIRYAVPMDNNRYFWRWREMENFEIDDPERLKVGRKFDVAYIGWNAAYNRPDWVENILWASRKLSLALAAVLALEFLAMTLIAVYWLMGGPPPPRLSRWFAISRWARSPRFVPATAPATVACPPAVVIAG